jgi:hypothetical protein
MREQQIAMLQTAGEKLYNAARAGYLDNGRPLDVKPPVGVCGPRAGALEIYAGLASSRLYRILAENDSATAAQFIPWQFRECQVYMAGRNIRIEAAWPDGLANKNVRITDLNRRPDRSGQWAMGMTEVGSTAVMQIDDSRPHVLIAGTTGSGKTVATKTILLQLTRHGDRIVLLDGKGGQSLRGLDRLPGIVGPLVTTVEEARCALSYVVSEMLRRQQSVMTGREPKVIVAIEEIATFIDDAAIVAMVKQIAQMGRESRIHLIMTTQRPTAATLGDPAIKLNTPERLAMHVPDASSSIIVTGRSDIRADYLGDRGDAYAISPVGVARLQVGYFSDDEIGRALTARPEFADWPDYDPQIPESADRSFDDRAVAISLIHAAQSVSAPRPLGRPALIKMLDEAEVKRPGTDGLRRLMASAKTIVAELDRRGYKLCELTD